MKTYAEEKGKEPFNWFEALKNMTPESDWRDLKNKSCDWPTCAVGNQCAIIPRIGGKPIDRQLAQLGLLFHVAVQKEDKGNSLRLFSQIENRSAKLMREIMDAKREIELELKDAAKRRGC